MLMGVLVHQKAWIEAQGTLQLEGLNAQQLLHRYIGVVAGEQASHGVDGAHPPLDRGALAVAHQIGLVEH